MAQSPPYSLDVGHALRSPMERVCGWCRVQLSPGTQPATYVICARCQLQLEREVMRHARRKAQDTFAALSRREHLRQRRYDPWRVLQTSSTARAATGAAAW